MAVRIRLRRMGRKKAPHYRIVVADSKSPRDGRFVETLGYYKPVSTPARLVLDMERVDYWLGQGASASGTVASLIRKARAGGDASVSVGEEDIEARRAAEKAALEAKRKAETAALAAAAQAAKEAEAQAAAEAEAAKEAEAAAEAAAEAEGQKSEEGEPGKDEEKTEDQDSEEGKKDAE